MADNRETGSTELSRVRIAVSHSDHPAQSSAGTAEGTGTIKTTSVSWELPDCDAQPGRCTGRQPRPGCPKLATLRVQLAPVSGNR